MTRGGPAALRVGLAVLVGWAVVAVFWRQLAPFPPDLQDVSARFLQPGTEHWLGTDQFGRDVFSRLLAGARPVLVVAPVATALAVLVGTLIGLVTGVLGGWVDEVVMRATDAVVVFPAIIAAVVVVSLLGRSVPVVTLVVAVTFVPLVSRSVRAATLVEREKPYVEAARLRGEATWSLLLREILPNVRTTVLVEASSRLGDAVFAAATLSFLGLGQPPGSPEWGASISASRVWLPLAPWAALAPALAIASLVVGVALVADALRKRGDAPSPRAARVPDVAGPAPAPTGTDSAGLEVSGLSIAYETAHGPATVVQEVSFTVAPGEIFGLVGESGCGKSTLAYALGGGSASGGKVLAGRVLVDGLDLHGLGPNELRRWRAERLAFVHQDAAGALDPTMRVGRQLELILRDRGLTRREARSQALELLGRVRLPEPAAIARRYPHQLSGGQQQRVVIAAALAVRPRLLVLDEPTTGLDASVEHEVLGLLAELRGDLDAAVVFVSHDLAMIGRMCDRVGVLYAGRLVEVGGVGAVLAEPAHPYTAALLAAAPVLGAARRERPLRAIPGRVPLPGEALTGCAFAPRCALADDACRRAEPALVALPSGGHEVRCLHPGEATAGHGEPEERLHGQGPDRDGPALLEVRGLVRTFGRAVVVDQVDLTIHQGEVLGLVGESGSGKTTLARAVAGLGPGGAGEIRFKGAVIPPKASARYLHSRRRIQMVFQNPDATLNPSHTVRTTLARALRSLADAGRTGGPPLEEALADLTARTRIDQELLEARPRRLSGGQKQRVAIARSLAGRPDLVICDEPVSALDVSVQAAVLELLATQRDQDGTSYLFISHDLAVVSHLADRIAVMYRGRIVETGPTAAVLDGPSHPYTAALLEAATQEVRAEAPPSARPAAAVPSATGCRFADRCGFALPGLCDQEQPPVRELSVGHRVRCHLEPAALPVREPLLPRVL